METAPRIELMVACACYTHPMIVLTDFFFFLNVSYPLCVPSNWIFYLDPWPLYILCYLERKESDISVVNLKNKAAVILPAKNGFIWELKTTIWDIKATAKP